MTLPSRVLRMFSRGVCAMMAMERAVSYRPMTEMSDFVTMPMSFSSWSTTPQ